MMIVYFLEIDAFTPPSFSFIVIGYICVILNHLTMQPRILAAIERLNYIYLHRDNFEMTFIPVLICMMKLIVELSIELL